MTDEQPIYNEEKMQQKVVYPTKQTPSYADWALYNMGAALEEKVDGMGSGLPEHTSEDAGKVLKVTAQNEVAWATDEQGHAQVQANWNETDNTQPSYIQNKPTIPAGYEYVKNVSGGPYTITANGNTTITAETLSNEYYRKDIIVFVTYVSDKVMVKPRQEMDTNQIKFDVVNSSLETTCYIDYTIYAKDITPGRENPEGVNICSVIGTVGRKYAAVPISTTTDADKVLTVGANGVPAWQAPSGGSELPAFTTSDDGKVLAVTVDSSGTEPVAELNWMSNESRLIYYISIYKNNNTNKFAVNGKELTNSEFYDFMRNSPSTSDVTYIANIFGDYGHIRSIDKSYSSAILFWFDIASGRSRKLGFVVYTLYQNSFTQNTGQVSTTIEFLSDYNTSQGYIAYVDEHINTSQYDSCKIKFKPCPTGTPAIASGDAGKILAVKSDETGTEWVTPSGGNTPTEHTYATYGEMVTDIVNHPYARIDILVNGHNYIINGYNISIDDINVSIMDNQSNKIRFCFAQFRGSTSATTYSLEFQELGSGNVSTVTLFVNSFKVYY